MKGLRKIFVTIIMVCVLVILIRELPADVFLIIGLLYLLIIAIWTAKEFDNENPDK